MGRPTRQGIDYFSHDCNQDSKIEYIEALHGIIGYAVYWKLLERIYAENGYYLEWSKKRLILFAKKINVDPDTVENIISDCISEGLFDENIYKNHSILTSRGIQKRYKEATRKRTENNIEDVINLLKNEFPAEETIITAPVTNITTVQSTQSKVKESKVNNPYNPQGDNLDEILFSNIEEFRKLYPGQKDGELKFREKFLTRCKRDKLDPMETSEKLLTGLNREFEYRQKAKLANESGQRIFIPDWKMISTWINQHCWDQEFAEIPGQTEIPKIKPSGFQHFGVQHPTASELGNTRLVREYYEPRLEELTQMISMDHKKIRADFKWRAVNEPVEILYHQLLKMPKEIFVFPDSSKNAILKAI